MHNNIRGGARGYFTEFPTDSCGRRGVGRCSRAGPHLPLPNHSACSNGLTSTPAYQVWAYKGPIRVVHFKIKLVQKLYGMEPFQAFSNSKKINSHSWFDSLYASTMVSVYSYSWLNSLCIGSHSWFDSLYMWSLELTSSLVEGVYVVGRNVHSFVFN